MSDQRPKDIFFARFTKAATELFGTLSEEAVEQWLKQQEAIPRALGHILNNGPRPYIDQNRCTLMRFTVQDTEITALAFPYWEERNCLWDALVSQARQRGMRPVQGCTMLGIEARAHTGDFDVLVAGTCDTHGFAHRCESATEKVWGGAIQKTRPTDAILCVPLSG